MSNKHDTDTSWMQKYWRPAMGWSYCVICLFDFMLAPILLYWFSWATGIPIVAWVPLTIQGSGLYHLSMGAIVGITSYSKTQERIKPSYPSYPSNDSGYIETERRVAPDRTDLPQPKRPKEDPVL